MLPYRKHQDSLRSRNWLLCLCLIVPVLLLAVVVNARPASGTASPSHAPQYDPATPTPTSVPGPPTAPQSLPEAMAEASAPVTNSIRGYSSLAAHYFSNQYIQGTPVASTSHGGPIDFHLECWGEASPYPSCKLHNSLPSGAGYSARWVGELAVPVAGDYTFRLDQVDDGARLYMNSTLIADAGWNYPSADTYGPVTTLSLSSGTHDIIVDYMQRPANVASLSVRWSGPGFGLEVINTLLPGGQTLAPSECPFGSSAGSQDWQGEPINSRTGNYFYNATDIALPALGQSIYFERSYSAQTSDLYTKTLGYGWTHNYDVSLLSPDDEPGTVIIKGCRGSQFRFTDKGAGEFAPWPGVWATLTRTTTSPYTYTLVGVDQTSYVFNSSGQLVELHSPDNHTLSFGYTSERLSRVADATDQRYLDFAYDIEGRLAGVTDPLSRTVGYGYDLNGDLVIITDTRGYTWTYTYTGTHLLHEVSDPLGGLIEKTAYDDQQRAVRQWTALSENPLIIHYGETVVITDALGHRTEDVYAGAGTLAAQSREDVTEIRTYDPNLNWTSTTDANGHTTGYDFNAMGLPEVITDALGADTTIIYDTANHPTQMTDALGNTTIFGYEGNRLITTTDALGGTAINTYDGDNLLIRTVAQGITTTYAYDAWGRRTAVTDTAGLVTRYGYDAVGRLITTTASTGLVAVNVYDDGDNLIRVTRNYTTAGGQNYLDLYNQVTDYGYDAVGRRTHVTGTLGLVTTTEYDTAGRVVRTTRNYLSGYAQNYQGTYNLVTAYGYDDLGRQVLVTDTLGSVTTTEYDALDRVARTRQHYLAGYAQNYQGTYNLATTYGYDAVGNQTHVTDTLGSVTYTEYDDLNRPLRTWRNYLPGYAQNYQNTYNLVAEYAYDAVGNQVWVTDTLDSVTYTEYDDLNRAVTVTTNYVDGVFNAAFPDEDLIRITTYDTAGRVLTTRDPASRITYHEYDTAGHPVTVTANYVDGVYDPAYPDEDVKQVTVYDATTGRVTARLQVAGTTIPTTYGYDVLGRLVTTTNALSGTTVTQYDVLGRRAATVDAEGAITSYGYDGAGRLVTTTNALSGTVVTTYDALGRRVAQTNPLGYTGVYTYDGAGRLVAQADPLGNIAQYAYDALGRRTVITDADGAATTSVYNTLGQLVATTDSLDNTTAYVYDALGRRTVMTDANGIATQYMYDDRGRLTAVVENQQIGESANHETNVETAYTYDVSGNLTEIEDALGHTTVYTYDLMGRRTSEADALGHVTGYTYDGHGRRTGVAYPDATDPFTVTTAYNALGWATDVVYPGVGDTPGFTATYGYNALGHREAVTDATGTMAYDYDDLYRPLDIDAPAGEVQHTYDAAGQRTHLIYPTGEVVTYTHDAAGRLGTVTDWDGGVTVYTYTAAGRLSALARPNGVTSAYTYDDAGRLVEIEHRDGGDDLLARYTYTLDAVGNRTGVTEVVVPPGTQATMPSYGDRELTMSLLPDVEPADTGIFAIKLPGLARLLPISKPEVIAQPPVVEADDPSPDWLAEITEDLQQAEYEVTWTTQTVLADLPAAYQAPNRAHGFRTYFTEDGVHIVPRTEDGAGWELSIRLTGYGNGHRRTPLPVSAPQVRGQSVRYQREAVEEWYINDMRGLEQGFTISAPPAGVDGHVALDLSFEGTLTATLADTQAGPQGDPLMALEFISPAGERVLRYDGLVAYDATGQPLAAELVPLSGGEPLTDDDTSSTAAANESRTLPGDVPSDTLLPPAPVFVDGVRLLVATHGAVYPITVDPLVSAPEWSVDGGQAYAHFGYAVDGAGDVNGDGYDDVVVGAPDYDNGQTDEGRVFVYHGSSSGLSTTPAWTQEIDHAYAYFGRTVSRAGDVNGDGYDDVVVGAPDYDNGQTDEGRVFVYHGSSSGLSTTPVWTQESDQAYAFLGRAVSSAGDVNGDGYDDIIVGVPGYTKKETREGRVLVYHGSSSGLGTRAAWAEESDQAYAYFGHAVGNAGDVNGDGYDDVIIGAPWYDNGENDEGRAYVFYGSNKGVDARQGYWTGESDQVAAVFGYSVDGAGDVNGDGYSDIVVGASDYDNGQTDEGRAYVYHGSSGGVATTPAWTQEGDFTYAHFGEAVSSGGDVNNDGYSDVIVGAPGYANGQTGEGRAFVYHGSSAGLDTTPAWMAESNGPSASFGETMGSAGDVNGDSYGDVIVGANGYTNLHFYEGRAYAYYGTSGGLGAITGLVATNASPTGLGLATVLTATVERGAGVGYAWAFGDGNTGSGAVVTHTYPDLGTYVAVVTATNSINAITATTQVTVTDRTISGLTAANDGPMELGRTTTLTAAVSAGSNVSYAWAFGDGATGNGAVVTHTYSSVGIHTAVVTASNSVSADTTTTDVSITEAPPVVITYTYDPLNRLTGASYSTGENYAYEYDAVGNRVAMTDTTGTTSYTYDDANRLTSIEHPDSSTETYTWDDRGNLTHDGVFTYTYSAAGRMVRAESVTATLLYTYTVDGLRIAQDDDGVVTSFAWDWATGVPEMLSDGESRYLVGFDTLGWEDTGGWTFVLPDALGSVRQTVDASGTVVESREWSPYGVEVGDAQAGLGYTGEWFDTGVELQYLRARWYAAEAGQFTSLDTAIPDYQRPGSIHRYAYVENNVTNLTDPSGLRPPPPSYSGIPPCDQFQVPDNDAVPGDRFTSPSACLALNWVKQRATTFRRYADQYGVPPELPAGLLAAEIDLDHTLPGRVLDQLARIAHLMRSVGACSSLKTLFPIDPQVGAGAYWNIISTVDTYEVFGTDLGDVVSGDAAVHHATYVIVEEYMATHYGQPLPSGTSKPDYLPRLLTDEGSIEFTARMSRMLADYRTGIQAPHYSDLNLIDMAQIWGAWRAGIYGVTCFESPDRCGFPRLREFQEKNVLGDQAELGYPYFSYFRSHFALR